MTDLTRGIYRRIYSGFIEGQRINRLSLQAEAWFWRVLTTTDDFGNAKGEPRSCWLATVGLRENVTVKHVEGWLSEMAHVGLIAFYEHKGERFLHVTDFEDMQPSGRNGKRIRRFPYPEQSEGFQNNPETLCKSMSEEEEKEEEDHTEKEVVSRQRRKPTACDDDFLSELQAKEAYRALDVRRLYAKMVVWCEQKGKQPTRMRLVNWLNREDIPMGGNGNGEGGRPSWMASAK